MTDHGLVRVTLADGRCFDRALGHDWGRFAEFYLKQGLALIPGMIISRQFVAMLEHIEPGAVRHEQDERLRQMRAEGRA